jgi:hypothetical protein
MNFDGYKLLVDERSELGISIRFGFQPSACSSSGRRAEVNQHRLMLCFGLTKSGINIFVPRNGHRGSLKTNFSATIIGCFVATDGRYFAFSCRLLEIAVTNFLGITLKLLLRSGAGPLPLGSPRLAAGIRDGRSKGKR